MMTDPSTPSEHERRLQQIVADYLEAEAEGRAPETEAWLAEHPEFADELRQFLADHQRMAKIGQPLREAGMPLEQTMDSAKPGGATEAPLGTIRYFGDYELLEEIARGGMGVVYKARQVKLNRIVAVKMILAGQLADGEDVERFYVEARAAARLHHPGIVAIHEEVGAHDGQHYFSMDYIEGESLAARIACGPLPAREAAELIRTVALAVSFAHVENVIHRDLKPANVLLDRDGQPHVTDFGLAKQVGEYKHDAPASESARSAQPADSLAGASCLYSNPLTATGQILGTPSYMPPEQAAGKTQEIGPRSDVYSLGAVLYCALTGHPPFQAASPLDTLMQVLEREPAPPRTLNAALPRDLETICLKCLEKDPARRYASAQELADELQRFLDGKPIQARPIGAGGRAWRWCRRNPVIAGLSAALVFALVSGTALSLALATWALGEKTLAETMTVQARTSEAEAIISAADAKREAARASYQERLTRRYLYSAHMNLANEAWNSGHVLRVNELLDQHRPKAKHEDLRSFDWRYLWRECHRQQRTFALRLPDEPKYWTRGTVWSHFTISPDDRWIAAFGKKWSERIDSRTVEEVRLWDVATGTVRHTLRAKLDKHKYPLELFTAPAFSPDGKLFALVLCDLPRGPASGWKLERPRIVVRDVKTMKIRATIPLPHFRQTDRIAISPDNSKIVAGFTSKTEKDEKLGYEKLRYTIMVWDLPKENQPLGEGKVLRQGDDFPYSDYTNLARFTFSADGESLLWGKPDDSKLTVTPLSGQGKDRILPIFVPYHKVSPDGKYITTLLSGSKGYDIKLFNAKSGKEVHAFPVSMSIYNIDPVHAFSPDGRLLAITNGRGFTVAVWDVETKKEVGEIRGNSDFVTALGFGSDGKTVITVANNKYSDVVEAKIWDVNHRPGPDTVDLKKEPPKRVHPEIKKPIAHRFHAPDFSSDGQTAVVLWNWGLPGNPPESRAIELYDLRSGSLGKKLLHLKWDEKDLDLRPRQFKPEAVSFSPDGKWLAVSGEGLKIVKDGNATSWEGHVQIWRLAPGPNEVKASLERTFFAPQHDSNRDPLAVFSPDGKKLIYVARPPSMGHGLQADRLHVYDLATGRTAQFPADPKAWFPHVAGLQGFMATVLGHACSGIVFSSDGRRIFTAHRRSPPSRIIAWNAASGEVLSVLESPEPFSYSARQVLALSKDDRTLAICNADNSIYLWAVSDQELSRVHDELERRAQIKDKDKKPTEPAAKPKVILRGHADRITAVTFHPDGKILASASLDHTIKLWDVATGEVRLTLEGHKQNITALAFTPDGNTLISGDTSGTVKLWRATGP